MSTPLEVIQEGEREFEAVNEGLELMKGHEDKMAERASSHMLLWSMENKERAIVIQHRMLNIHDQTLELLQALHDELEGNRLTVDDFENSVYGRYPEFCAGMNQQNQFIQDQQDNLQALIKIYEYERLSQRSCPLHNVQHASE